MKDGRRSVGHSEESKGDGELKFRGCMNFKAYLMV